MAEKILMNMISADKARQIADALDDGAPITTIKNLLNLEKTDAIIRVQAYAKILKEKDNEKAVRYRQSGYLKGETYDILEEKYSFHPVTVSPEKQKEIFCGDLLNRIGQLCDLTETQTKKVAEMNQTCVALNQSIRLLINTQLNNKK